MALVTGASSGLGAAIARRLVEHGLKVVAFARRLERLQDLEKQLEGCEGKLYTFKGDVRSEADVVSVFEWIDKTLGGVHVLVNNAGIADHERLTAGSCEEWRNVLETNVVGLSTCSREAVKSMKAHNVQEGFIINMNSVLGHEVRIYTSPMYTASKFAVTALTQALAKELGAQKSGIKVLSISPGLVESEMTNPGDTLSGPLKEFALAADDIAESVVFMLSAGPKVHIQELTVTPGYAVDFAFMDFLQNKHHA